MNAQLIYSSGFVEGFKSLAKLEKALFSGNNLQRSFRVGRFSLNYMLDGDIAISQSYSEVLGPMVSNTKSQYWPMWREARLELLAQLALDLEGLERFESPLPEAFESLRADMAAELLAWNS